MEAQRIDNDIGERDVAEPTEAGAGRPRLEVSGIQVCASTLASVSAAAVASIFGVAGTILGAAVVSLVATVGGALYSHRIRHTGAKLQEAQVIPVIGAGRDRDRPSPRWREWLAARRWGVVAGVALVFVASLVAVTLIELVGRQPLANASGGDSSGSTSVGALLGGGHQKTPPAPTPGSTDATSTTVDPDAPAQSPETATTAPAETGGSDEPEPTEESPPATEAGSGG
jgi:hypothetical protein